MSNLYPKMASEMFSFTDPIAGDVTRLCALRFIATKQLVVFPDLKAEEGFVRASAEAVEHHTWLDSSHSQSDWGVFSGLFKLPTMIGRNWTKVYGRVRQLFWGGEQKGK
jgi:hypothetical protein